MDFPNGDWLIFNKVFNLITFKLFYHPKRVPKFLKDYKNPCWKEPKRCRLLIHKNADYVKCIADYETSISHTAGDQTKAPGGVYPDLKLRCIPEFYVIGSATSGTKDLMDRLSHHPNVVHRTDVLSM